MSEVWFYHMTRTPLEEALPALLTKALSRGWRSVVMMRSEERVEAINNLLWTFDDRSFLPHGSKSDGHAGDQPVWLTTEDENPNGAKALFLTDGAETRNEALYERVCVMFDGHDEKAVETARELWVAYREAGHILAYMQQSESGGWRKTAEADGKIGS